MPSSHPTTPVSPPQTDLRLRAQARLKGRTDADFDAALPARQQASAAMRVLYELATSPDTATDALALLHELQVHQVELDMQTEALEATRAELQARLDRLSLLHDHAPVACFSVDADTRVVEANLRGARALGLSPEALAGRQLSDFVAPRGALQALLQALSSGEEPPPPADAPRTASATLQITPPGQPPRSVLASVAADPAGSLHLLCLSELPVAPGAAAP